MEERNVLLTTRDAARLLDLTADGVRWLEETGQLRCERTLSGQRLFRYREVLHVVEARAKRRLQRLAPVPVRMLKLTAPRPQLPLPLGRRQAKVALQHAGVKGLTVVRKTRDVA